MDRQFRQAGWLKQTVVEFNLNRKAGAIWVNCVDSTGFIDNEDAFHHSVAQFA